LERSLKSPISSLNLLRAFEAAARHGSLTRAAEELLVQQPAVSRQVKELERQMGVQLFRRGSDGLSITPEGAKLFQVATSAISSMYHVVDELRETQGQKALTVNASIGMTNLWLLPRIEKFKRVHPEINVEIWTRDHKEDPRAKDAALRIFFGVPPQDVGEDHIIFREKLILLAAPKVIGEGAGLKPLDLMRVRLLRLGDEDYLNDWSHFFSGAGLEPPQPDAASTFRSFTVYLHALRSGQGVGIGWATLMDDLLASGELEQVSHMAHETDRAFYCDTDAPHDPHVRRFISWLAKEGKAASERNGSARGS